MSTVNTTPNTSFMQNMNVSLEDKEMIISYIDEMKYSEHRDNALIELSK
jgi:hypothetical protein